MKEADLFASIVWGELRSRTVLYFEPFKALEVVVVVLILLAP